MRGEALTESQSQQARSLESHPAKPLLRPKQPRKRTALELAKCAFVKEAVLKGMLGAKNVLDEIQDRRAFEDVVPGLKEAKVSAGSDRRRADRRKSFA